jgi:plastocyanin
MLGVQMRSLRRLWTFALPGAVLLLASCGQTPEATEKARGVLTGVPVVLALSVLFVVLAVGAVGAAVVVDRAIRSRKELVEGPPVVEQEEDEEEQPEVVAGITVGRAAAPRWLYGAYVLIPVFALAYVLSNVAVAPATTAPAETAPPSGPCTECEIAAAQIQFDSDELEVVAGEEITATFNNNDTGVPHDFTVWKDKAAADAGGDGVATTGTVNGGASGDVSFAADDVTYFNCTIHPTMFGDVTAVEG